MANQQRSPAAPWDRENDASTRDQYLIANAKPYQRVKATWDQDSLNTEEQQLKDKNDELLRSYVVSAPWTDDNQELLMKDFAQTLDALNYTSERPWQKGPEETTTNSQSSKMNNYKFQSMWERQPISAKQQAMIDSYKFDPPFVTEANEKKHIEMERKRLEKIKKTRRPPAKTISPWAHGALPGDPIPDKSNSIAYKPTSLWDTGEASRNAKPSDLPSSGDPILDSLRLQLRARGAGGIVGLGRKFKIMDDDGSGTLDVSEFTKAMKECDLDLTLKALQHLFRYFDKDDSGLITYDEFLVGIRGVLNERRKAMVKLAFDVLDVSGNGEVDMEDMKQIYNAKRHPEVIKGDKTEEEILRELMRSFEGSGPGDGKVILEEFENYYSHISASVDDDDYFELMIRNAWNISGGEGWCANTANKRILVTHADGSQTVEEVKRTNAAASYVDRLHTNGQKDSNNNSSNSGVVTSGSARSQSSFVDRVRSLSSSQQNIPLGAGLGRSPAARAYLATQQPLQQAQSYAAGVAAGDSYSYGANAARGGSLGVGESQSGSQGPSNQNTPRSSSQKQSASELPIELTGVAKNNNSSRTKFKPVSLSQLVENDD